MSDDEIGKIKPIDLPAGDEKFLQSDDERGAEGSSNLEPERSPEEIEAEKLAREKLETISNPRLNEFVIRFVNFAEYEEIMQEDRFPNREVNVVSMREDYSFADYVKSASQAWSNSVPFEGWHAEALEKTRWAHSVASLTRYNVMMRYLLEARKSVAEEEKENPTENRRTEVIKKFRELLTSAEWGRNVSEKSAWFGGGAVKIFDFLNNPNRLEDYSEQIEAAKNNLEEMIGEDKSQEVLDEIARKLEKSWIPRDEVDWEAKKIATAAGVTDKVAIDLVESIFAEKNKMALDGGEENIRLIKDFLETDDLGSVDFRKVFNALAYVGQRASDRGQQYQIAMIFNSVGAKQWVDWPVMDEKQAKQKGYEPSQCLMTAIALMPNRELYERMIEITSKSGKWGHPVLDCHGKVRFPTEVDPNYFLEKGSLHGEEEK